MAIIIEEDEPSIGQRVMSGYKAVSDPVTSFVSKWVAEPVGQAGSNVQRAINMVTGGMLPEPPADLSKEARTTAEMLVPQTPAEFGMALLGPVGRGVGKFVAPARRILGPALGEIIGGVVGAGAGARASGEAVLPAAGKAAVGGALGEIAGPVYSAAQRGFHKSQLAHEAADKLMKTFGDLSPGLKVPPGLQGRTGSERLRDLVGAANVGMTRGPGREGIGQAKEAALRQIEQQLPPAGIPVPYLSEPPIVGAQWVKAPTPVPLRQANEALTEIGQGLRHRDIWDPTIRQQRVAEEYGALSEDIRKGLETVQPDLGQAWNAMQGDYKRGLAALDLVRDTPGVFTPTHNKGLLYDQRALQKHLVDPKVEDELIAKLSPEDLNKVIDTVSRGAGLGYVDRLERGGGGPGQAALEWLRGRNTGSMGPVLAAIRAVVPGIGDQYVGRNLPYDLPAVPQNIVDYLTQRGLSAGIESLPPSP